MIETIWWPDITDFRVNSWTWNDIAQTITTWNKDTNRDTDYSRQRIVTIEQSWNMVRASKLIRQIDAWRKDIRWKLLQELDEKVWVANAEWSEAVIDLYVEYVDSTLDVIRERMSQVRSVFGWQNDWDISIEQMMMSEEVKNRLWELIKFLELNSDWQHTAKEMEKASKWWLMKKWWFWTIRKMLWWSVATIKASLTDNVERLNTLENRREDVQSIVDDVKAFPTRAVENIDSFAYLMEKLISLKEFYDTKISESLANDNTMTEAYRKAVEQDINNIKTEIEYLIWLLEYVININVWLISKSWDIWRLVNMKYIRALFTLRLAVLQGSEEERIKKWVVLANRLDWVEKAALESISWWVLDIHEAAKSLAQNNALTIEWLTATINQLDHQIERCENDMRKASEDTKVKLISFNDAIEKHKTTTRRIAERRALWQIDDQTHGWKRKQIGSE